MFLHLGMTAHQVQLQQSFAAFAPLQRIQQDQVLFCILAPSGYCTF
jgi:hypothetical protein